MQPENLKDALDLFGLEHPELIEAMEVFGIASAEYERAIRALYPSYVYTSSSTTQL